MKNKFKLLCLLICFVAISMMVSCNKDEATIDENASIVASWKCTYSFTKELFYGEDGQCAGERMEENKYKGEIMTLSEDGSVYINSTERGSYTKTTTTIIFNCKKMVYGLYKIVILTNSKFKIQKFNQNGEVDEWCDVLEFERM